MSAPSPHRLALEQGRVDAEARLLAMFRGGDLRLEVVEGYAEGQARGIGAFVAVYVSPRAARNCLQSAANCIAVPGEPPTTAALKGDPQKRAAYAASLLFASGFGTVEIAALFRRREDEITILFGLHEAGNEAEARTGEAEAQ